MKRPATPREASLRVSPADNGDTRRPPRHPAGKATNDGLEALVRACCREFGLDAVELAEALAAARRDPANAWISYRAMARELCIDLSPAPLDPLLAVGDGWSFIPAQAQRRKP